LLLNKTETENKSETCWKLVLDLSARHSPLSRIGGEPWNLDASEDRQIQVYDICKTLDGCVLLLISCCCCCCCSWRQFGASIICLRVMQKRHTIGSTRFSCAFRHFT